MKRILFLHDRQSEPDARRHELESVGFLVTACGSGPEALEALDRGGHDLVVMDVLLSGRHGFDVCREIRRRHRAQDLPIVMLSGIYRKRAYHDAAAEAGAQRYLVAPVGLDVLVEAIHAVHVERAPSA